MKSWIIISLALDSIPLGRFLGVVLERVMKLFGVTWAWKLEGIEQY